MANILGEITEEQLNHYVFDIIPKLEQKMVTTSYIWNYLELLLWTISFLT